jgi:hypothetical protein
MISLHATQTSDSRQTKNAPPAIKAINQSIKAVSINQSIKAIKARLIQGKQKKPFTQAIKQWRHFQRLINNSSTWGHTQVPTVYTSFYLFPTHLYLLCLDQLHHLSDSHALLPSCPAGFMKLIPQHPQRGSHMIRSDR